MGDKLLDQIFNLKFTSKQLNKQSQKSAKEEKSERLKVKKAIEKGNLDGAKIYAQNAIRKKNESLNYLRLASRLDAVVSRLDTQAKMQSVNKSMAGIVKALDKSLASNNLEQARSLFNLHSVTWFNYYDDVNAFYCILMDIFAWHSNHSLTIHGRQPSLFTYALLNQDTYSQSFLIKTAFARQQVANTMDQFEKQFENLDIQSEFVENAMNAQASLSTPEDDVNMLVQQVAEEHNLESMLTLPAAGTAHPSTAQQADKSDLSSRLAQLHNQK